MVVLVLELVDETDVDDCVVDDGDVVMLLLAAVELALLVVVRELVLDPLEELLVGLDEQDEAERVAVAAMLA